jgi:hypothetical protein
MFRCRNAAFDLHPYLCTIQDLAIEFQTPFMMISLDNCEQAQYVSRGGLLGGFANFRHFVILQELSLVLFLIHLL